MVKNESVVKGSDVVNERLQISPEKVFCEDAKVNKLDGIFIFGEKSEVFGFFERFGQQIPARKGKLPANIKKHSRNGGKSKESRFSRLEGGFNSKVEVTKEFGGEVFEQIVYNLPLMCRKFDNSRGFDVALLPGLQSHQETWPIFGDL